MSSERAIGQRAFPKLFLLTGGNSSARHDAVGHKGCDIKPWPMAKQSRCWSTRSNNALEQEA
jgi:hypothetical protein